MNTNELPLQQLFTKLREAGLPLGIDEYELILRSLQGGFGITDKAALKRLCQTLWVKSAEEKAVLEYHFDQVIDSETVVSASEKLPSNSELEYHFEQVIDSEAVVSTSEELPSNSETVLTKPFAKHKISKITSYLIPGVLGIGVILGIVISLRIQPTQPENISPTPQPNPTTNSNPNTNQPVDLVFWTLSLIALSGGYVLFKWTGKQSSQQSIEDSISFTKKPSTSQSVVAPQAKLTQTEDEVQVVKSVMQATSKRDQTLGNISVLNREFFPLTQRQMKHVWRYLRRPVREGKPTELDLEATIDQIGQQGLLLDIVLVPPRVNRAELMILIDQDGSMVPFHTLSHKLTETALGDGRLRKTGIYYFHNSPVEYLYRDRHHQQGELVTDILTNRCSEQTAVLIFSDAGAARGGSNEERYKLTQEFLTQLQQRVLHIAWLNPIPKERWFGTTAAKIARLVPMFEVSRPSLQDAISVLRGRPTNFDGRRK